jgi:hypothetical protein
MSGQTQQRPCAVTIVTIDLQEPRFREACGFPHRASWISLSPCSCRPPLRADVTRVRHDRPNSAPVRACCRTGGLAVRAGLRHALDGHMPGMSNLWMGGSLMVALSVLSLPTGGCTSGSACVPGSTSGCSCAGGSEGQSVCTPSGDPGACQCGAGGTGSSSGGTSSSGGSGGTASSSGSSGSSSGVSSSSSGSSGGTASSSSGSSGGSSDGGDAGAPEGEGGAGNLAFGAACTTASQCSTDDCQLFAGMGGDYCTKPCTVDSDCPNPPNLGCNGMGYCKVP